MTTTPGGGTVRTVRLQLFAPLTARTGIDTITLTTIHSIRTFPLIGTCVYTLPLIPMSFSLSLKTGCDSARFLGAVSREGHRSVLCVPGVLCGSLVPGRVLVLLTVHPLHAGHLRGHSRQTGLRNLLPYIHTSHIQLSEISIHIHMISNSISLSLSLSPSLLPYLSPTQQQRNLSEIRKMGSRPYPVQVYRGGKWQKMTSEDLLPGDLISVGACIM